MVIFFTNLFRLNSTEGWLADAIGNYTVDTKCTWLIEAPEYLISGEWITSTYGEARESSSMSLINITCVATARVLAFVTYAHILFSRYTLSFLPVFKVPACAPRSIESVPLPGH